MNNFEIPQLPEVTTDIVPEVEAVQVEPEVVALRGAGKLSEVLGPQSAQQLARETRANSSMNYRWALHQYGGVPRA